MDNFLTIRNFGSITDITLELKPVMIITGGQGTGKSTIAKLISIFSDVMFYLNILQDKKESLFAAFNFHGIQRYFQADSFFEYKKKDIHLIFDGGEFRLLEPAGSSKEVLTERLLQQLEDSQSDLFKMLSMDARNNKKEFSEWLERHSKLLAANSKGTLYIPAERNLAGAFSNALASMLVADIPLPQLFTTYLSFFEKAKNELKNYEVPFLNLAFQKVGAEERIVFNEDKPIELQYCSSGVQSVLPLLMIIDYCLNKRLFHSFIIEEPEQNLFPENQLALIRSIIHKLNSTDSKQELVITTHSPYVLSTINLSLIAGKIAQTGNYNEELAAILPHEIHLDPSRVCAYSLGDKEVYAHPIINERTGTIDQNYLDSTSSIISETFQKLYHLYVLSLKK